MNDAHDDLIFQVQANLHLHPNLGTTESQWCTQSRFRVSNTLGTVGVNEVGMSLPNQLTFDGWLGSNFEMTFDPSVGPWFGPALG